MTIPTTLLDEALEAWEGARKGIIEELKCVPPQHLHYRPESGARTVAEIVQHVVDTSLMWAGEADAQQAMDQAVKDGQTLLQGRLFKQLA